MVHPPINLFDFEARAKQVLPHNIWDFVEGGAQDEVTVRRNREAFERMILRPRRLVDVSTRSLKTTVLGQEISLPVMVAPAGSHNYAHPDAEVATAQGAGAAQTVITLSAFSSRSIEDVARVATGPRWFQLYPYGETFGEMLIKRAEAAGYSALCVTVDVAGAYHKDRDRRNRFPQAHDVLAANFMTDEARAALAAIDPKFAALGRPAVTAATWKDIDWYRSHTKLPLVLKGIMTGEDAELCLQHGVDAIIVSNHGGRHLDGQAATLDALPEVVEAVGGRCEVYMDGGVRRGADVAKALALGARAVFIGRPIFWGLAVAGAEGVRQVFDILRFELDMVMAYCGRTSIGSIDASLVRSPAGERHGAAYSQRR